MTEQDLPRDTRLLGEQARDYADKKLPHTRSLFAEPVGICPNAAVNARSIIATAETLLRDLTTRLEDEEPRRIQAERAARKAEHAAADAESEAQTEAKRASYHKERAAAFEDRAQRAEEQCRLQSTNISRLNHKLTETQAKLAGAESRLAKAEKRADGAEKRAEAAERKKTEEAEYRQDQHRIARQCLDHWQEAYRKAEKRAADAETHLARTQTKLSDVESQLAEAANRLARMKDQDDDRETMHDRMAAHEVAALRRWLDNYSRTLNDIQSALGLSNNSVSDSELVRHAQWVQGQLDDLTMRLTHRHEEVQNLKSRNKELAHENATLKTMLAQRGKRFDPNGGD